MAMYFGALTLLESTCPLGNIFVDAGPHILCGEEVSCCTDAGV